MPDGTCRAGLAGAAGDFAVGHGLAGRDFASDVVDFAAEFAGFLKRELNLLEILWLSGEVEADFLDDFGDRFGGRGFAASGVPGDALPGFFDVFFGELEEAHRA